MFTKKFCSVLIFCVPSKISAKVALIIIASVNRLSIFSLQDTVQLHKTFVISRDKPVVLKIWGLTFPLSEFSLN